MGILRIVRMEFELESIEQFDKMFHEVKHHIEAMPGCQQVLLFTSPNRPAIRTTLSWWSHEDDLNAYRSSKFFGEIWPKTKANFKDDPIAWSVQWNVADGMTFDV